MNKAATTTQNSIDKSRILIVDDQSEDLHAITAILGDTYAVFTSNRGQGALKLAARKPQPDLILLDIKMPGMDGYEVLRRLKADRFTADIPIIIVTGMPESEDDARALMLGAADYVSKPINPDWLKLRVQTQLELRRFRTTHFPPAASADGLAQKHSRILVVDDVPASIHPLTSALSDEYRIMVADNGKKAVEIVLGPSPPDLVLMDINMPDMDGYEVCRRIKATERGNQIPIIFLSVIDTPMEKVRGFSIGAADFISKPFDVDEVRARVRTHLELSQLQRFFESAVELRTAELRKNESQLSEALNIARIGYWEYEIATDEFLFNDQYYALHKITADEAGGYRMSTADFARRYVFPEDARLIGEKAQQAFESADPDYSAIGKMRLLTGAGEIVWVEVRLRIEKDAQGRTIRVMGVSQDVTERVHSEASLRKLSLAVEQSPNSIVITNLDASIEYVNTAFCKTTGYSRAEIIGQNPRVLHSGKTPRATYTDMWAHLLNGQVWKGEFINKRKDGSEYTELALLSPIRQAGGDVTHYLAIKENITELKQTQEALYKLNEELEDKVLKRTAELESARSEADHANHAKSDFLAAMSHEIRTPMNGVIGMLDALQQSSLSDTQMGMTNVIHDSAYALLNVINDILDFSKIEAGKITLDNVPMDFTKTVEGVADMLVSKALKKDVSLLLFIDPALPRQVIGDAGRLRQILANLADNAIKFSAGGKQPGKVSLRVRVLKLTGQKVSLEFSITDNGIGMDKATQAGLFTPFTQANESIATRFGGTGLGLVITQQLVGLMGGEIAMSSELDKGTEVLVRLGFDLPSQGTDAISVQPPLAGLDCLLVGLKGGIADDMAAYLADAGVKLERVDDVDAVRQWLNNNAAGEYVVVFDHAVAGLTLAELRATAGSRSGLKLSFVMNLGYDAIGQQSDYPRPVESGDLVMLDATILHRDELVRAAGIAAGRIRPKDEAQQASDSIEHTKSPPTREEAIQQGCLILVAEDNKINQVVIGHQLRLLNRIADVAGNGREALEMWQSGDYGILLADLGMPEMNGYELCTAIRAAENGKSHIPIIAFTANAMKGEAEHCLEMGMDDYLSKPVQLELLEAALDKWLPPS